MKESEFNILNLPISDYKFDKFLEFLYWEREKQHDIELKKLEILKLDLLSKQKSQRQPLIQPADSTIETAEEFTEEERKFNAETSFRRLGDTEIGKIAKTRLWNATKLQTNELLDNHKDLSKDILKLKVLIHHMLWASSLAHRAERWPQAKDIGSLLNARQDLKLKLDSHTDEQLIEATRFIQEHWGSICPNPELYFNTTLMGVRLDEALALKKKQDRVLAGYNVLNSPFIKEMLKTYGYINTAQLESRIKANNYDYFNSFIFEVMVDFRKNRPPQIEDNGDPWPMQIPVNIDSYQTQLEKDAGITWERLKYEQTKWDKERRDSLVD
jgi:hypothetical protein